MAQEHGTEMTRPDDNPGPSTMIAQKLTQIRVLTAADLHQSRLHYRKLAQAVEEHRPDIVAIVGDALCAFGASNQHQFSIAECARILSGLPVRHVLFVRGNHEDSNWTEFVAAWPHERRKLVAVYGARCTVGPLVITGFPCMTGSEFHWCAHLPAKANEMELSPAQSREPLPTDSPVWLPGLMRRVGAAGRTLWFMHESPVAQPLANPGAMNPGWAEAVERFAPRLVIAGHDHDTPLKNGIWHTRVGETLAVNVGQAEMELHYALLNFDFMSGTPSLPCRAKIRALPWEQDVILSRFTKPRDT